MDSGHCYTLITDPLYSAILQVKLFNEIERSTYFVIQVRFNEDMLSPKNATLLTLREAHRAGCGCYLIYLANGIQMSRFLRFADRFVIMCKCRRMGSIIKKSNVFNHFIVKE